MSLERRPGWTEWDEIGYRLSRESARKLIDKRLDANRRAQASGYYQNGLPVYEIVPQLRHRGRGQKPVQAWVVFASAPERSGR